MLRRTKALRLMEGMQYRPLNAATLPVLAQDIDQDDFHTGWMPGLYSEVSENEPFAKCKKCYHRRVLTAAPCTLNGKCLRVPLLVDTGAPTSYLHTYALKRFFEQSTTDEHFPNKVKIMIGTLPIEAQHNACIDGISVTSHLNILGMDFLEEALPDLLPWLSENFSKFQSPLKEVFVSEWNATTCSFPVNFS